MVEGIRTKMMIAASIAADHVKLIFEMYAESETSFGDITRYFEEQDIKIYGKSLFRTFVSQLLRNPGLCTGQFGNVRILQKLGCGGSQ